MLNEWNLYNPWPSEQQTVSKLSLADGERIDPAALLQGCIKDAKENVRS